MRIGSRGLREFETAAARRKCKIMSHCVRPRCGGDRLHSPSDRRRGPCAAAALHARRVLESVKFDVCPSVRVRVRSSVFRRRRSAAARPPLLFRKDTRSIHPSREGQKVGRKEGRKKEGDPSDPRVRARPPLRVAREEGSKLSPGRPGHRGSFLPSFRPRNEHFSTRGAEEKEGLAQYGQCTPREVHAAWTSLNSTLVGSKYPDKSALSRLLIGCMRSGGRGWRTGQ